MIVNHKGIRNVFVRMPHSINVFNKSNHLEPTWDYFDSRFANFKWMGKNDTVCRSFFGQNVAGLRNFYQAFLASQLSGEFSRMESGAEAENQRKFHKTLGHLEAAVEKFVTCVALNWAASKVYSASKKIPLSLKTDFISAFYNTLLDPPINLYVIKKKEYNFVCLFFSSSKA